MIAGELHVLESHEESRVELLLLLPWSRHDVVVVGGKLVTVGSVRLRWLKAGARAEDASVAAMVRSGAAAVGRPVLAGLSMD